MKNKKVSFIMSVYKESETELKRAFESIINQTYKNLEIIVVIDYPDEKWREEFIKSYKDKRVNVVVNEKNIGLTASLNKALKYVTGDYIARMDADDYSHPNRIEKQLEYMSSNDYDLVGCNMNVVFEKNDNYIAKYPSDLKKIKKVLSLKNCVPHPTWLGKKEVFEKNNGYRDIFSCEDYDFIIRSTLNGFKISNCDMVLFDYYLSVNSISRSNAGKQEVIADYLKKNYRKNKCVSLENFKIFINSKRYSNQIKHYDFYYNIKNKRIRTKHKKFPMYYLYSLIMILDLKFSLKEFILKFY